MPELLLAFVLVVGCGGDDDTTPPSDGAAGGCAVAADCDDGLFCNGSEACDPSAAEANARGCVAGTSPCAASAVCDDAADRCIDDCATEGDLDGDGVQSLACGGGDCDDSDAARYPGNPEICDAAGVDEDCDPTTFGDRDADGDGHVDAACCNGDACGDDCDDDNAGVHGDEAESCDGLDNDCDGTIDEGVTSSCWADADADGFAAAGTAVTPRCGDCGTGFTGRDPATGADCDDDDPISYPGAREVCDRVDNDCSDGGGVDVDEDADDDGHTSATYTACEVTPTSFPRDDCNDRNADVFPGQGAYFSVPTCPVGSRCTCTTGDAVSGCPFVIGGGCDCSWRSWNYDCNDTLNRQPPGCSPLACGLGGSCTGPGPAYSATGPLPRCGSLLGRYESCGPCTACTGVTDPRARLAPLRCR